MKMSNKEIIDDYKVVKEDNDKKLYKLFRGNDKVDDMVSKTDNFYSKVYHKKEEEEVADQESKIISQYIKEQNILVQKKKKELPIIEPDFYTMFLDDSKKQKAGCVMQITSQSTVKGLNTNGIFDSRLGPETNEKCTTCKLSYRECDGHKGWIPFPEKIPSPTNIKDMINTNNCICWCCGKPIIPPELHKKLNFAGLSGANYRKELANLSLRMQNSHVHHKYKHIQFDKNNSNSILYFKVGDSKKKHYSKDIDVIYKVYNNLNDEDLKVLGFTGMTHPISYIMDGIIVIPPRLRKARKIKTDLVTDHFLSTKYLEIIKIVNKFNDNNKPENKNKLMATLYQRVDELMTSNDTKGIKGVECGLIARNSKKKGLPRKNALGKRNDNNARTVVIPLSSDDCDRIGVPQEICNVLLTAEVVTEFNFKFVMDRINKGLFKQCTIIKNGSEVNILLNLDTVFIPEFGNVMYRPLNDTDLILVNRQPSLHKPSIMSHRVKPIPLSCIQLHQATTAPYNCDFDGDEMNLNNVKTSDARVELKMLTSVVANVVNYESNKPMIGPAFHSLIIPYYVTTKWVFVKDTNVVKEKGERDIDYYKRLNAALKDNKNGHEFTVSKFRLIEIFMSIKQSHRTRTFFKRCEKNNIDPCSGRAIFSLAFPSNFYYADNDIKIVDGILISGVLKSTNIGKGQNSLVQVLYKTYSNDETLRFISDFTRISDWLTNYIRFSIGYQSFFTNREEIKETLNVELNKIQTELFNLGPEPDNEFDRFYWNKKALSIADSLLIYSKNVGNSHLLVNNPLNMLSGNGSGGKGSDLNISQITALLGLQKLKGNFQVRELNNGKRILPTFLPGDLSLQSKFFILNSFSDGISPSEEAAHCCASREGLLATAAKTSESGYTRRRIQKSVENNIIDNNGRCSTVLGKVYQFSFDGIHPGLEVFSYNKRFGNITFFCNVKDHEQQVNGMYEYITKYMPDVDKDGKGVEIQEPEYIEYHTKFYETEKYEEKEYYEDDHDEEDDE